LVLSTSKAGFSQDLAPGVALRLVDRIWLARLTGAPVPDHPEALAAPKLIRVGRRLRIRKDTRFNRAARSSIKSATIRGGEK
jgi:hypothetical protein